MQVITAQSFFDKVSSDGLPEPRAQKQPWRSLLPNFSPDTNKSPQEQRSMVVLCSQRHDYGK